MYSIFTFIFLFVAGYFVNRSLNFTGIAAKNIDESAIRVWKFGVKVKNYAWLVSMIIFSVSIISLVLLNGRWFENQANDLIGIIDLKLSLNNKDNRDKAKILNEINLLEAKIYRRENSHWPIYIRPYEKSFHRKNPIISMQNK